jgi:hypothetical protein
VISIPVHCSGLSSVAVSYSIVSDTDHSDADADADSVSDSSSVLVRDVSLDGSCSDAEYIAVIGAIKENTRMKLNHFCLPFKRDLAVTEYVKSSKNLQYLDLGVIHCMQHQEIPLVIDVILKALYRNTSVTKLIIHTDVVRCASMDFQEVLTCTQTLQ